MNFKTVLPEYGEYTDETGASSLIWDAVRDTLNVSRTATQIRPQQLPSQSEFTSHPVTLALDAAVSELLTVDYRVIHKSLRDFRTRLRNNQDRHSRKEHINRYRISPSFFILGALAYFQIPPLGGSREEKRRSQWIRKCSVLEFAKTESIVTVQRSIGSCTTQNHLQTKKFVNGTWIPAEWLPVRCETNWLSFGKFQDRTLSYSLWTPFFFTTTP